MSFACCLPQPGLRRARAPSSDCNCSTKPRHVSRAATPRARPPRSGRNGAGRERISTIVAALVDTNVLVYRYDSRFPEQQKVATELLRRGIAEDSIRVAHQCIVEFVAVMQRLAATGKSTLS